MKHLDPKSVWLFFWTYLFMWFFVIFFMSFSILPFFLENILAGVGVFAVVLSLPFFISYIWANLTYKNYKYEIAEQGFKKESGVIFKKYVTIPYDRIQNVDIYRGVIARMLGLSDLHIQTAGMSYSKYGASSEGRLPGLSMKDAESMRDDLINRATHARGRVI